MPRCGSLPHSSRHTALPTTAPGTPADHSPQHLPLPLGRGSGGLYHGAQPPARGSGPSTGPDDSCTGALSQKAGGHVSISGVTPDMRPCAPASLSTCSFLQGSLFPRNLLQILLQMPPLDRLDLEPLAGHQGPQLRLHGHRVCPSSPRAFRGHAVALSTTAARQAPFSAGWEWSLELAAGHCRKTCDPSQPSARSSLSHPHATAVLACAAELLWHWHVHPRLWERAGNAPCSPVPVGFSCCASL